MFQSESSLQRPVHLSRYYADQFLETSVAQAYHYRPEYPPETFDLLDELIVDEPRRVLDIGCGTGFIARNLVDKADTVDAVDMSAAMIETGRLLTNGGHPHLNWIHSTVEDAALSPPYALVTAGQSLHWMDWEITLARVGRMLTGNGCLAIVELKAEPSPWESRDAANHPALFDESGFRPKPIWSASYSGVRSSFREAFFTRKQ